MQNLSCENEFYLHEHKKSFSSVAWHLVSPWNRGLGQIGNCVLAIETKALAPKRKTRSENMTALHCFVTDACSRPETRNYLVFVDFSVRCCGLISQNVTNLPNWGWWAIAKSVFFFFWGGGGAYLILLHCFGPLRTDDGSYTPYKPSALLTARILGTYEACISLLHQGTVSRIFKACSYWLGRPRYSRWSFKEGDCILLVTFLAPLLSFFRNVSRGGL